MAEAAPNLRDYSVSELAQALKRLVEDAFGLVRVRGEISGLKRAASGHVYLGLKDADAFLDGVMWKGQAARLRFKPEDGLEVIASGRLTTYPGRSKYQLVIETMEPAGAGALMALLEERKRKLAAEGLFESARKRKIPYLPQRIGLITSPTGAVLRDILHRLADRFPRDVLLWPVQVQGESAAGQIASAIAGMNALPALMRPDVLIVARGGGSIEDLWAFNEEEVVRAAAGSAIPLISAVGHETDTTLIDYASDLRAPTPTAAAEFAVPVREDLLAAVADKAHRLEGAARRVINERRTGLAGLARGLRDPRHLLDLPRQRLDGAGERLPRALLSLTAKGETRLARLAGRLSHRLVATRTAESARRLEEWSARLKPAALRRHLDAGTRLGALTRLLDSLSYRATLARGFSVVRDEQGRPITMAAKTKAGAPITIEWHDGQRGALLQGEGKAARAKRAEDVAQPRLID